MSGLETHHARNHPRKPLICTPPPTRDPEIIRAFLSAWHHEIVCVVEGIDAITSHTVRGLHSYKAPSDGTWENLKTSDIVWDGIFRRCVSRGEDGACVVDFDAFHDLVDVSGETFVGPPPPASHS